MNFPETIWLTIFVGPREKPGPATKGWCKTGRGVVTVFILSSSEGTMKVELAPNADVESDKVHNSSSTGWVQNRTKVFTNEGTSKDCVPVHWALKGIREHATRSQIHCRMRTKDLRECPQQPEEKIVLWNVIQPNCWVPEVDPLLFLPLEKPRETTFTICWTSDGGLTSLFRQQTSQLRIQQTKP